MFLSYSKLAFAAALVKYAASEETITGTIFCDNYFEFWFNGNLIVQDAFTFAPHQAVSVSFSWDGTSDKNYAILCEDYQNEEFDTGYEYVDAPIWDGTNGCCYMNRDTLMMDNCTSVDRLDCPLSCPPNRGIGFWEDSSNSDRCDAETGVCTGCGPWIGDGSLLAEFSDGTKTNKDWKVFVTTFGPTDSSIENGCSYRDFNPCEVDTTEAPMGWNMPGFDDSNWDAATEFTVEETGWGRSPIYNETTSECCGLMTQGRQPAFPNCLVLPESQCLNPKEVLCDMSGGAICPGPTCTSDGPQCDRDVDPRMIWSDDLQRAQQILFRYTVPIQGNDEEDNQALAIIGGMVVLLRDMVQVLPQMLNVVGGVLQNTARVFGG